MDTTPFEDFIRIAGNLVGRAVAVNGGVSDVWGGIIKEIRPVLQGELAAGFSITLSPCYERQRARAWTLTIEDQMVLYVPSDVLTFSADGATFFLVQERGPCYILPPDTQLEDRDDWFESDGSPSNLQRVA